MTTLSASVLALAIGYRRREERERLPGKVYENVVYVYVYGELCLVMVG